MKKYTLIIWLFSLISCSSLAHVDKQDISLFEVRKDHKNLKKIVNLFEVTKEKDEALELYIPSFKTKKLLELAPKAKMLKKSIYLGNSKRLGFGYKKFNDVVIWMKNLAKKYPGLVKLESYGKSVKGENLYYLKISDNVGIDEDEPELLITAATHGDELITTETLIRFITNMLEEDSARVKKMIQDHELFFVPVVNPDGFKRKRRYTADGTDPNREYPYPEKPNKKSVKCIKEEINFFHSRKFVATMDLHAHGKMIMYPWGFTKDPVPQADKNLFESLGKKMARDNNYKVGQISRIIYVAPASSADYFYWKGKAISYGIELTSSKAPMAFRINSVVKEATEMIYTFIEEF